MPRKKLSAIAIATLPAGEHWDTVLPGLTLVVGKRRRKWTYRYRSGGRYLRLNLGYAPAMGLGQARDAARKAIERIDAGAPAPEAAPHPRATAALTLGNLLDQYERMRAKEGGRVRTLPEAMRTLRVCLAPWLSLPAAQFTKADLRAARDAVIERGALIQGNRLLGYLGPVMRWAALEDLVPVNFVRDMRRSPERKRSRVLTDAEIKKIWVGCDNLGNGAVSQNFARLVKFLLLTAQRRDECASLRYGDIADGVWHQTANKADRPHNLKLPPLALSLVGKGEAGGLVFPGERGKIRGYSKLKRALEDASGVSDWRLHDLRRTAASRMQKLGVANHIVQAVLNHAIPGVGAVYLRAELDEQKAAALAAWAAALTRITKPMRAVA